MLYFINMIIINAVIALGHRGELLYMAIAMILSIALAYLSTVTIGRLGIRK